jgi:hypothetical protein
MRESIRNWLLAVARQESNVYDQAERLAQAYPEFYRNVQMTKKA